MLKHFYRYLLVQEQAIPRDPSYGVRGPKQWQRVPDYVSEPDFDKLMAQLISQSDPLKIRDKAMLWMLFGSGFRAAELLALKITDVDLANGRAEIWHGKGGKDAVVPLSARAVEALTEYLEYARPILVQRALTRKLEPTAQLFLARLGHPLTRQELWLRLRELGQVLQRDIHPHLLRHGCATALIKGGADVRDVQAIMRHSDINTTQRYVHLDLTFLKGKYYENHPRASP